MFNDIIYGIKCTSTQRQCAAVDTEFVLRLSQRTMYIVHFSVCFLFEQSAV